MCNKVRAAAGMTTVMDGPETGPFNLGNPAEFTMLQLAKMVQEVVNPDIKIIYKENTADDPSRRKPDITKVTVQLATTCCTIPYATFAMLFCHDHDHLAVHPVIASTS